MSTFSSHRLARTADMLANASMSIASVGIVLMMLHITVDVVCKRLFNSPLPMTLNVVSHYYMVAAVFLPMAFVETRNAHFRVDVAEKYLPSIVKRAADIAGGLIGIFFFGLLAWQTGHFAVDKFQSGEIVMAADVLIIWPTRFFVPIGAALYALVILMRLLDQARNEPQESGERG